MVSSGVGYWGYFQGIEHNQRTEVNRYIGGDGGNH